MENEPDTQPVEGKNMTTLKSLIEKTDFSQVEEKMLLFYPDQKSSIIGYAEMFDELKRLPVVATSTIISITHIKDEDGYEFENVSGIDENGEVWGLDFTPWEEWLNMEIEGNTILTWAAAEIIAHCMWEMTFYGFEQGDIQDVIEEIQQSINDYSERELTSGD